MYPMRRVGQALDMVQVRYVIGVGVREFWAEVAVALAPDDEGGRLDWAKLGLGAPGCLSQRGPVIVDAAQ
jgi:hypothetical protein